jgi:hypothetical protein
MRSTRHVLSFLLVLALTAPVPAFAQSAGDDQYTDPFSDPQGQEQQGGGSQGSEGTVEAAPETQVPEAQVPPDTTAADPSVTTEAPAADAGETLPVTGPPVAGLVLGGVFLLAGGVALRRRA